MKKPMPDMKELAMMVEEMPAGESCSNTMKYVVIVAGGKACAIVFPDPVVHANMLDFLNIRNGYAGKSSLLSSGFCRFGYSGDGLRVVVWGESESIRKKLRGNSHEDGPWRSHPDIDVPAITTSFVTGPWDYMYPHDFTNEED
jgi:hypothetical protein